MKDKIKYEKRYERYYQIARENEEVFRNILRDIREPREKRPLCFCIVPKDLETELELSKFFKKYSEGNRTGKFTITDFTREDTKATIGFQDLAPLSGISTKLEYLVKKDNSIEYNKPVFVTIS